MEDRLQVRTSLEGDLLDPHRSAAGGPAEDDQAERPRLQEEATGAEEAGDHRVALLLEEAQLRDRHRRVASPLVVVDHRREAGVVEDGPGVDPRLLGDPEESRPRAAVPRLAVEDGPVVADKGEGRIGGHHVQGEGRLAGAGAAAEDEAAVAPGDPGGVPEDPAGGDPALHQPVIDEVDHLIDVVVDPSGDEVDADAHHQDHAGADLVDDPAVRQIDPGLLRRTTLVVFFDRQRGGEGRRVPA